MPVDILFLHNQGSVTGAIFDDMISGYRQAGHNAHVLDLTPIMARRDALPTIEGKTELITRACDEIRALSSSVPIDMAVCLWGNGPAALGDHGGRNFFDVIGLPVVMQWLDAPQWAHGGQILAAPTHLYNGPCSFHIINNPGTAQEMAGVLGFSNIIVSSNAACPERFQPKRLARKEFDIVFGVAADHVKPTPLMLRELESDEPDVRAIRADEAASLRDELCDAVRPGWESEGTVEALVDRMIEVRLENRHAPIMEQLAHLGRVEPEWSAGILALLRDRTRFVSFTLKLRRMESWERAFMFVYLARYFKCATFGFKPAFQSWPGEWTYLGELPHEDQCQAYSRGLFGLNVMRWQDDLGLNLKPFEITLSGACLLQAHRVGFGELFTESEAVSFDSPNECRDKVADLLASPARVVQIAGAGRARSLAQHCWKHRAEVAVRAVMKSRRHAMLGEFPSPHKMR